MTFSLSFLNPAVLQTVQSMTLALDGLSEERLAEVRPELDMFQGALAAAGFEETKASAFGLGPSPLRQRLSAIVGGIQKDGDWNRVCELAAAAVERQVRRFSSDPFSPLRLRTLPLAITEHPLSSIVRPYDSDPSHVRLLLKIYFAKGNFVGQVDRRGARLALHVKKDPKGLTLRHFLSWITLIPFKDLRKKCMIL